MSLIVHTPSLIRAKLIVREQNYSTLYHAKFYLDYS